MPNATQWMLRRLASRAKRVVARRKDETPALSVFALTTPGKDGKPLPYKDKCQADLDARIKVANKEWPEADAADRKVQALLEATRLTGGEFERELIALRKTLASHTGRSDKDYQKLRTEKAGAEDPEDDPNAPKPPGRVAPAPPCVNEPNR